MITGPEWREGGLSGRISLGGSLDPLSSNPPAPIPWFEVSLAIATTTRANHIKFGGNCKDRWGYLYDYAN